MNILVQWDISKKELLEMFINSEYKIYEDEERRYFGCRIEDKLFGSEEPFGTTFHFIDERLTSIGLLRGGGFQEMQTFLEEKFGKPGFPNPFWVIFRPKNTCTYKWKLDNVIIMHSLFDRDDDGCLAESLEIVIK